MKEFRTAVIFKSPLIPVRFSSFVTLSTVLRFHLLLTTFTTIIFLKATRFSLLDTTSYVIFPYYHIIDGKFSSVL